MCYQCFDDLQKAYDFKKKCLQTEEKVKNHLKKRKYRTCFKISEIVNSNKDIVDLTDEKPIENKNTESFNEECTGKRSEVFNDYNSEKRLRTDFKHNLTSVVVESKSFIDEPESILPIDLEDNDDDDDNDSPEAILPITLEPEQLNSTLSIKNVKENVVKKNVKVMSTTTEKNGTEQYKIMKLQSEEINLSKFNKQEKTFNLNHNRTININSSVTLTPIKNTKIKNKESIHQGKSIIPPNNKLNESVTAESNRIEFLSVDMPFNSIFRCSHCNKDLQTALKLRQHMRLHKETHKCKICNRCFTSNGNLRRHLPTHSDFKPFSCIYCKKSFPTKVSLKTHARNSHKKNISDSIIDNCYVDSLVSEIEEIHDVPSFVNIEELRNSYSSAENSLSDDQNLLLWEDNNSAASTSLS